MDLIAPGVGTLVEALDANTTDGYKDFGGTSAATPHTAGVAALVLGFFNQNPGTSVNLAPEDVEQILQISANDRIDPTIQHLPGYDDASGWGLLDAGRAVEAIEFPDFNIEHHSLAQNGSSLLIRNQIASYDVRAIAEPVNGLAAGLYYVEIWEVTAEIPHQLQAGFRTEAYWARNSASNLYAYATPNNIIQPVPNLQIDTVTNSMARIRGYAYHILGQVGSSQQLNTWLPFDISNSSNPLEIEYSIYARNSLTGIEEPKLANKFLVYPNPTSNNLFVAGEPEWNENLIVEILDLQGRVIKSCSFSKLEKVPGISIADLPQGMYLCRVSSGNLKETHKIIIQR